MATVRLQNRRGTYAQWQAANPTLAAGEMGIETDTRKVKIGDGTTAWNSLSYMAADAPEVGEIAQDAINDALVAGTGITKAYNDGANTITVSVDTSVIATKAELAEVAQDSINDALTAGTGITKSYNDTANTLTVSVDTDIISTVQYVDDEIGAVLTNLNNTVDDYIPLSQKGQATGVATLDANTLVPLSQLTHATDYADTAATSAQTAAESTASTALTAHQNDTTNIHGIPDTAQLATKAYADQAEADANTYTDTAIANVIGAAPSALNTLQEIAASLDNDADLAGTLTSSIATKVTLAEARAGLSGGGGITYDNTTGIIAVNNSIATRTYVDDAETAANNYTNGEISTLSGNVASTYAPKADPTFTGTVTLPSTTHIGSITSTEIGYLDGITGSVQGQIDDKLNSADASATYAPKADPTFTGTVTLPSTTHIGSITSTEIGYLDGITSSVQGQIDDKLSTTTAASTYAPLAAPIFTGNVTLPSTTSIGNVDATEISYINGVTSSIQTQIDSKAPTASPTFTGTVTLPNGTVTSAMIAADTIATSNIADTAITDAKLASNSVTNAKLADDAVDTAEIKDGAVTSAKIANGTIVNADINAAAAIDWTKLAISSTVSATELGYVDGVTSAIQTQIDAKLASATAASTYAPIASPTFTGTVSGVSKSMVGLGNVDNTSDANKPVSTATQTALDLKAPIASPTFTGTVSGVSKSMVGLGNVDNTSDANKPVSTATQTALDAKLALAGGTMTGALTLSGAPTADSHAATKAYVDNVSAGINFHQPVRVATTGNITLSGTQTIDGVSLSVGDRVLVKDQTTQTQNGIYVVASGSWTRATDADNSPSGELAGGDFSLVLEGTVNSGYGYVCSNTSAITIGTTNITYAAFNAAKAVSAGSGLTETTPGTLAVDSATVQYRVSGISDTEIGYLDGVTSAIQTQLDAKAPIASPTFTGTVSGVSKSMVGLGNVDNTSDANKPVSTATQTALDLKAPIASPTFTGTVTVAASGVAFTDGTQTKEGVPSRTVIYGATNSNAITADTTLSTLAYRDALLEVNSASAVTLTVPPNSTTAYPIGTSFDIVRMGAGTVTIAAGSGVTINYTPGNKLRAQYSSGTLFKRGTDTWLLIGDLTA